MRRNGKMPRDAQRPGNLPRWRGSSLKHEKDDVREVRQGFECGVALKGFNEFAAGDILECYVVGKRVAALV